MEKTDFFNCQFTSGKCIVVHEAVFTVLGFTRQWWWTTQASKSLSS